MNQPMTLALALAVPLVLLGLASGYSQVRGMRRLRGRTHVPSDEFAYLRGRHRRRLVAAGLMVVIGGLIAGAYLSGMEHKADALGEQNPDAPRDETGKRPMTPDERQFVRAWGVYWIVVVVLAFALIGVAVVDAWAARRYWLAVYRQLREDHNAKLRRDLAVYREAKRQARGGRFGNRLGGEG